MQRTVHYSLYRCGADDRGYNPRVQRLVFNDMILEDHMKIKDCDITATSTLVLCLVLDNGDMVEVPI